ncbi:P-loop containing nucleoside triphosphate hydrolase [Sesbania bispinosa]|nr:P-loop containing nucleoside triphosphate hydrolase [Sesbania bispinosa]
MTVGGATALAAGVYTTREGAKVTWGYINRILGQPSLIRESSMEKFPEKPIGSQNGLGNVILHPSLQRRIEHLARATSNTKAHQAPFRNMLFYGPPGTGKTMVAREIARKSKLFKKVCLTTVDSSNFAVKGLDYAMMTGGDVAPLGPQAVTKIHELFDWAKKSRKGLLLFIDEADAFLCEPWGDEVVEDAKAKAEEAKDFASEAMHDAKETTESWANWARDKFSESFGSEKDEHLSQNMKYQAEDAASRATGTMKSAASGASEYASQKATDAKEAVSGAMAYGREKTSQGVDEIIRMPTDAKDRMGETYEGAKQKMYTASDKASNMAHNAKDNMAESIGYGRERAENAYEQGKQRLNMVSDMASEKFYDAKDKASDVYDEARDKVSDMASGNANDERFKMASQRVYDVKNKVKGAMDCGRDKANEAKDKMGVASDKMAETFDQAKHEVGDAYLSAKNTMTEEAKSRYEAAKEKASEATGELGAKMRNSPQV